MALEGWVDGWMDGWMGGEAGLRIAYLNQKCEQTLCLSNYKNDEQPVTI